MGTNLAWFYDVFCVGLLIAFMYIGAKRGFIKSVLILIGYLVALFGGYIISSAASNAIYEKFIEEKAYSIVEENIDNINVNSIIKSQIDSQEFGIDVTEEDIVGVINKGGDLFENISQFLKDSGVVMSAAEVKDEVVSSLETEQIKEFIGDNIPKAVIDMVVEMADTSKDNIIEVVTTLASGDKEKSAEVLTVKLVEPVAKGVISLIIWIISFAILMVILRIIINIISSMFKAIPLVSSVNTILGAVLGVAQGILIIIVICLVLKLSICISSDELMFLNTEAIQSTKIFKIIYNLKLLK